MDNTESIDMEMSDEDFDTIPEFQSNLPKNKHKFSFFLNSFLYYF